MSARKTIAGGQRSRAGKFAPHSRSLFEEEVAPVGDGKLTEEQVAAISTRDVSIGLSAGAGCGKTEVLIKRFLTYLAPPEAVTAGSGGSPLSRVVAITFTDRAAREMRDRIRVQCSERLRDCESESEALHWLSILRDLDAARISTIHSFCSGLLHRHAVAARIDPQFRPLEVEVGETLLRQSVARAVKRLLEKGDPNCFRLLTEFGLEPLRRSLRKLVRDRSMLDAARFRGRTAAEFAAGWTAYLHDTFLPRAARDLAESELISQILLLLRESVPSNRTMQERCRALLGGLTELRETPKPDVARLFELREFAKVQGGGGKSCWPDEETYEAVRDALERLRRRIDEIGEFADFDACELERAAEASAALVSVVEAAADDFAADKAEAGVLDFDDLLVKTRDLLRSEPEVRKEAAASIDALLVDEYQDTDPVQAEIVDFLIGSGLNSGKLFVVGDSKQSIYRFRGADPSVFDATRRRLSERGRLPLTRNFRSQPEIINFVNSLFEPVMSGYERLVPQRSQCSPLPSIEFLFAFPGPDEEADSDPTSLEEHRRREADWIARRILALLDDPTPRVPERNPETGVEWLRRVKAGDIAVLFRAMSDAAIYEDVFRRRGVEYYLVGGRAFFAQQEVYDLVNLCTFLNDPADSIALVGVLRSPFFSLSDDTIVAMTRVGDLTPRQGLHQPPPGGLPETQCEQLRLATRVVDELLDRKDRIPLAELLELALERTAYDASLLCEFLGNRKVANLRKLIDMARQFDRSGIGTLADFTRRIQDSISEQSIEDLAATHPESSDVVRLMTIHQAKGLEFPVVILADMERKNRPSIAEAVYHRDFGPIVFPPKFGAQEPQHPAIQMHRYVEEHEDDEESLRILYVALTRAADHLILSAGLPADPAMVGNRAVRSQWLRLLADRYDLGTGLPKGDPYFDSLASRGKNESGAQSKSNLSKPTSRVDERPAIPQIHPHRKPPDPIAAPQTKAKKIKLSQWRELVEDAEADLLPPLMTAVSSSPSGPLYLSVSQIEEADALLRKEVAPRPKHRTTREKGPDGQPEPLGEAATFIGSLIHRVIERLPREATIAADAIAAGVQAALKDRSAANVRDVDPQIVIRRVQSLIESDLWGEMSSAQRCFREIDFLLGWSVDARASQHTAIISGTLDCLLLSPAGAWKIVDYKTGRLPFGDPAALREHFAIQLVLYAEAVRAMVGRPPEAIEIVSLHDTLNRFPILFWDEFRRPILERINAAIRHLAETSGDVIDAEAGLTVDSASDVAEFRA
jgi:ATP-dependent helicase/nuclease subunit A